MRTAQQATTAVYSTAIKEQNPNTSITTTPVYDDDDDDADTDDYENTRYLNISDTTNETVSLPKFTLFDVHIPNRPTVISLAYFRKFDMFTIERVHNETILETLCVELGKSALRYVKRDYKVASAAPESSVVSEPSSSMSPSPTKVQSKNPEIEYKLGVMIQYVLETTYPAYFKAADVLYTVPPAAACSETIWTFSRYDGEKYKASIVNVSTVSGSSKYEGSTATIPSATTLSVNQSSPSRTKRRAMRLRRDGSVGTTMTSTETQSSDTQETTIQETTISISSLPSTEISTVPTETSSNVTSDTEVTTLSYTTIFETSKTVSTGNISAGTEPISATVPTTDHVKVDGIPRDTFVPLVYILNQKNYTVLRESGSIFFTVVYKIYKYFGLHTQSPTFISLIHEYRCKNPINVLLCK